MGAATSFILGMGMTVTAAYVFLAIVLAPSLITAGLDPMAVHMFILYWGMLSFITPPVALGAFAAAAISGSDPMRAGFTAMRIGSRSEEHTSELQSLMRISYAVFCLKKKTND